MVSQPHDEKAEGLSASTSGRSDATKKADGVANLGTTSIYSACNPSFSTKVLSSFPGWVSTNLRSPRSWKMMFRCWIACWASFVIILPNATLRTLGTTSFFALLTSLFLPPYLPVQLFFFIISTLMFGLLFGWGLGVAAMRGANAARDPALLHLAMQQVQASISASPQLQANPALAQTIAIFNGNFLDTRATVVYGCFLGFGAFLFGLMRAYAPKLLFMSVFGTIALDIFCSYGPLFPAARYTLLNSTAISISCYVAIALLTTIFVYPETMNASCLNSISNQLGRIEVLMELQDTVLSSGPSGLGSKSSLSTKLREARAAIITEQQNLMAFSGFVSLEFSCGKWNGDDVQSLEEPLLAIVSRISTLQNFIKLAHNPPLSVSKGPETGHAAIGTSPDAILVAIRESTGPLRSACVNAIAASKRTVIHVNTRRWKRSSDLDVQVVKDLDDAISMLSGTLASFKTHDRLVALFARPESTHGTMSSHTYPAHVFSANLIWIASAVLEFAELVRSTVERRRNVRLWVPKGLRKLWHLAVKRGDRMDEGEIFGEDKAGRAGAVWEDGENDYRRDPDSRPPTNPLQRLMHALHSLYQWTKTPEALFTIKYVVLSITLWLPAVFKGSANFYYVQRGIWAQIMAQTTLNIYAADQIFNLVTRMLGTFIGLVLGLLAWYMGNGTGDGNAYGVAASTGLVIIPMLSFGSSPHHSISLASFWDATFALVIGYSWVDSHLPQFATPGVGWPVAWKRWVLVVIGAAASFIVMMLPPTSGRKAVRRRNAASVMRLARVYGFLIGVWIGGGSVSRRSSQEGAGQPMVNKGDDMEKADPKHAAKSNDDTQTKAWKPKFKQTLLALAEDMQAIKELTELARWEGSVRGKWPRDHYIALVDGQVEVVGSLATLGAALEHLSPTQRTMVLETDGAGILNPDFITDVMSIFTIVSQSLRTGEPMHQVLPGSLLERLQYHRQLSHRPVGPTTAQAVEVEETSSLEYMYLMTALVALYQLLQTLDNIHLITRELCGEVPLTGFSQWRDEYSRVAGDS